MPNPKTPQVRDSQIFRQWKLMEWLTAESEGITVAEAAKFLGLHFSVCSGILFSLNLARKT